ncbi:MAG: cell wall metabolism sensor histidine kinase WalK, partial [Bdellovibrionales bacterium]|nr:cell wall metabolism sensor histidine kinase WalK [Bdellovibrionales bacterium]
MKKITFGLNFKILIGICILLLICTGFNLLYSYNLFIEDKTSYIYETGLKRSENVVQQIQTHIESFRTKAQTYSFLSSLDSFNFGKYISEESDYLATGNLQLGETGVDPSVTNFVKSDSFLGQRWTKEPDQDEIKNLVKETAFKKDRGDSYNDIEFIHNFNGNDFLLSLYKNPGTKTIFFSLIDMRVVTKYVESDNIFSSQIAFLNSKKSKNDSQNAWLALIDYKAIKKGTQEISIQGITKLLSYSATPNYIIASSIDRDKAFGITKFLVIKTSLFACVLLGIAVACGIYFSSTITHPIEVLTAKSEQMAAGDFDQEVVVTTSDELSVLASTFNWMNKEIKSLLNQKEDMILQLEDYSKNLEVKVEQRTIELKNANDFMGAMINSLDQGLFVFDQSLECHDVYTNACLEIFGTTPPHKKFTEVLGITDETELGNVTQWAAILFSEMIPFESAVNLGPRTKVQGTDYTDPNFKHIQIDYYPMKDEESKIKSIVSVGTD